jgi:hypothetical protein
MGLEVNQMIVAELIAELRKLPATMKVVVSGYEGGYNSAHRAEVELLYFAANAPSYEGQYQDAEIHSMPEVFADWFVEPAPSEKCLIIK